MKYLCFLIILSFFSSSCKTPTSDPQSASAPNTPEDLNPPKHDLKKAYKFFKEKRKLPKIEDQESFHYYELPSEQMIFLKKLSKKGKSLMNELAYSWLFLEKAEAHLKLVHLEHSRKKEAKEKAKEMARACLRFKNLISKFLKALKSHKEGLEAPDLNASPLKADKARKFQEAYVSYELLSSYKKYRVSQKKFEELFKEMADFHYEKKSLVRKKISSLENYKEFSSSSESVVSYLKDLNSNLVALGKEFKEGKVKELSPFGKNQEKAGHWIKGILFVFKEIEKTINQSAENDLRKEDEDKRQAKEKEAERESKENRKKEEAFIRKQSVSKNLLIGELVKVQRFFTHAIERFEKIKTSQYSRLDEKKGGNLSRREQAVTYQAIVTKLQGFYNKYEVALKNQWDSLGIEFNPGLTASKLSDKDSKKFFKNYMTPKIADAYNELMEYYNSEAENIGKMKTFKTKNKDFGLKKPVGSLEFYKNFEEIQESVKSYHDAFEKM